MRMIARTALAGTAAAALLFSGTTSAHAETDTVKDLASDVVHVTDSDDRGTVLGYRDSIASGVDLRGLRVRHGKKTVTVRFTFKELGPETQVYLEFRRDGRTRGDHFLLSTSPRRALVLSDDDSDAPCTVRLSRKTDSISATIKRSCLGDPDRIKVSGGSYVGEVSDGSAPVTGDVISPSRKRTPSWTSWLTSG